MKGERDRQLRSIGPVNPLPSKRLVETLCSSREESPGNGHSNSNADLPISRYEGGRCAEVLPARCAHDDAVVGRVEGPESHSQQHKNGSDASHRALKIKSEHANVGQGSRCSPYGRKPDRAEPV